MTTALAMVSADLGITACLPYAEPMIKLYRLQMRCCKIPNYTQVFRLHQRRQVLIAGGREFHRFHVQVCRGARMECDGHARRVSRAIDFQQIADKLLAGSAHFIIDI